MLWLPSDALQGISLLCCALLPPTSMHRSRGLVLTGKRVQQIALIVVHTVHGCHQLPPEAERDLISAQEVLHCTQVMDSLLHWLLFSA